MAPNKILCVAEKPSIAKAVANHLGGGRVTVVSIILQCLLHGQSMVNMALEIR